MQANKSTEWVDLQEYQQFGPNFGADDSNELLPLFVISFYGPM